MCVCPVNSMLHVTKLLMIMFHTHTTRNVAVNSLIRAVCENELWFFVIFHSFWNQYNFPLVTNRIHCADFSKQQETLQSSEPEKPQNEFVCLHTIHMWTLSIKKHIKLSIKVFIQHVLQMLITIMALKNLIVPMKFNKKFFFRCSTRA